MRERVVGMEIGRAVVAFEHGDGAAWLQHLLQGTQGIERACEVLEQEADEYVIEARRREGQGEDVLLAELHVAQAGSRDALFRLVQSASVTVCAPVPQPASSTELPAG
jgi:hypothetical protein